MAKRENTPSSLDYHLQALVILKQVGGKANESISLNNIGEVYRSLGEYKKALSYFQQALAIHKQFSNKLTEGVTLSNSATLLINKHRKL